MLYSTCIPDDHFITEEQLVKIIEFNVKQINNEN